MVKILALQKLTSRLDKLGSIRSLMLAYSDECKIIGVYIDAAKVNIEKNDHKCLPSVSISVGDYRRYIRNARNEGVLYEFE